MPLKDKLYYEIGQNTLPDAVYAEYTHLSAVERGRALVRDFGWDIAFRSDYAGLGSTLSTGPTPLIRWAAPRAAAAGAAAGAGYLTWRYVVGSQEKTADANEKR